MAAASVTNLRNVRQKLLTYLRIGETSTSTSIGGDAEEINDTSRIEDEDYWVGGQVHITSGSLEGKTSFIRHNHPNNGEMHVYPAFSGTPASGITYEIYRPSTWNKAELDEAITAAVDWARERFLIPHAVDSIDLASATYEYDLPYLEIVAATATSGSTTTIVDTSGDLAQDDDHWNGATVIVTADTGVAGNVGEVRIIKDFDASTDTLTLDHALPGVASSGTTYRLIKYPFAYIHTVEYQDTTNQWVPLNAFNNEDAWSVVPGLYPRLRIDSGLGISGQPFMIYGYRYAGAINVESDLIEVPFSVIAPYVEYYLRTMRARVGDRSDPLEDRRRAREALEEAEIRLEQQMVLPSGAIAQ